MAVCRIISHGGTGRCLNIGDSYNITNGSGVNIYAGTGSMDQKWVIDNPKSTGEQFIKNVHNQSFGLNARTVGTEWNCTMYQTAGNADGYVSIRETYSGSGLYTIQLSRHSNKYLTVAANADSARVYWAAKTGNANQQWKIVVLAEPQDVTGAYITAGVDGWLKLYKNPTGRGGRTVKIPTDVASFKGSDGFQYKFESKNYWYACEPSLNGQATGITGAPPVKTPGKHGVLLDEHGNYWVAVGPNVVNPSHSEDKEPTPIEMYGRGKLDFVVKDSNGTKYYIPGVVGDAKNHTWSNGIIQTYKAYPDGEFESGGGNFNGTVCAEFIGLTSKDYLAGLGKYEIDSIVFYAH